MTAACFATDRSIQDAVLQADLSVPLPLFRHGTPPATSPSSLLTQPTLSSDPMTVDQALDSLVQEARMLLLELRIEAALDDMASLGSTN